MNQKGTYYFRVWSDKITGHLENICSDSKFDQFAYIVNLVPNVWEFHGNFFGI